MRCWFVLGLVACGTRPLDPIEPDPTVVFVDGLDDGAEVHVHGIADVIGAVVVSGTAFEAANEYVWHVRIADDGTIKSRRQYDLLPASPFCCIATGATTDGSIVLDDSQNLVVFDASGFVVGSSKLADARGRAAATPDGGLLVPVAGGLAVISPLGEITRQVALAHPVDIATPTSDGGVLAFGQSDAAPWIARLDAAGAPVWQVTGGPLAPGSVAGTVEPTADGGALVLVNADLPWLARLDAAGVVVWQKRIQYTIALPETPDALRALEQGDGSVIVFGRGNTPWVLRLDSNGALLGDRRLARTPSDAAVVDGEAVIFGQFENRRGLLYWPRDLSAGPCGGGLGATSLELVDATETLAPIDLAIGPAAPAALEPSNILSRASDVELSTSCP